MKTGRGWRWCVVRGLVWRVEGRGKFVGGVGERVGWCVGAWVWGGGVGGVGMQEV